MSAAEVLRELGVAGESAGGCTGPGGWLGSRAAGILESVNPATEEVLGRVRLCSEDDYERVVAGARAAFEHWRTVPAPRRGELVRRFGQRLREVREPLGRLVSLEVGKIEAEGVGEVQEMIDMADFAVGQSRMLYGLSMHSERPQHRMLEQWHPLGPVAVFTAFNFPVAVWAWNAFLAAVCGDTVVWKPSPKTPLTAIAVQHVANEVMAEADCPGVFSLFTTDAVELARQMVDDARFPLVSFTGSVPVGREVAQRVARRLGRSLLELSGNNAIVVDASADLDLAVRAIVFGAVGTAGQRCTTTRRLFVHESRADELVGRLADAYRQVRIGDPLEPGVLMGPLVDAAAVACFLEAIDEVRSAGGEVVCGGGVRPGPGFFVEPTIVRARNHWPVVQRETFGPILYVATFRTLEEAIVLQNHANEGLSSAIFTMDVRHAERFLAATGSDCGIANVNLGTSGAEIGGAFGGEKATGGGREAGSDAWKAYMRRQTSTINWGTDLPLAQGIVFGSGA